jgi:glycosyltransferase involved in cell wall biosynthesis
MIVTFVIPTRNEGKHLARCVRAIRRLTQPSDIVGVEIVIVDSGSTDDTTAIAARTGAFVIEALGATVARARNEGARHASGDMLAFVDADCELRAEWLLYGLEHLHRPGVAAMGTSLTDPPATSTWVERHWHNVIYAMRQEPYESVQWLPTSNLLMWRDAFDAVGGFNDTLITCEDCDFGHRLTKTYALVLEHRVRTCHLRESRTVLEFFRREWWRGLGNLQGWRLHGWNRRELWSVVGPLVFIALMLAAAVTAGIVTSRWKLPFISLEATAAGAIPFLMLIRRGIRPSIGISAFVGSYVLSCVYLSARGIAMLNWRSRIGPVAMMNA